ncbi:MAG: pyridoxamine kinase, partial [Oscillospiraceae bacterium]
YDVAKIVKVLALFQESDGVIMNETKSVVAIHDLSGFGRCSLSVISPILSVMGVQTVAVPTAVLSTHTGGFGEVCMTDLTDFVANTLEHYKRINLDFDCIYTGFLGSEEQIHHCLAFIETFKNALVVVDPVMGDNGTKYRTYTKEMCDSMVHLVKKANLITPNKTEMFMLLKQPFNPSSLTTQEAKTCLLKLSELGPEKVIVTGVELCDMTINNIGYDRNTNSFWRIVCSYVPVSYPGTGDIFASIVVASILDGDSLAIAMERATRFLELTIKTTYSYGTESRNGVMLEKNLGWLTQTHSLSDYQSL